MPELPAGPRERGHGWGKVWTQPRGAPSSPSPHQGWCRGSRAVSAGRYQHRTAPTPCTAAGIPPVCAGWAPPAPQGLKATPAPCASLPAGWIQQQGHGRGRAGCSELPRCWCQRCSHPALAMLAGVHRVPRALRPWGSALALLGVPALPGTSHPASHCPPLLVRAGSGSRCTRSPRAAPLSACHLPGSGCEAPAGLSSMLAARGASRVPGLSRWHRLLLRAMGGGCWSPHSHALLLECAVHGQGEAATAPWPGLAGECSGSPVGQMGSGEHSGAPMGHPVHPPGTGGTQRPQEGWGQQERG